MQNKPSGFGLITGASMGLGLAFARELSLRGMDTILVGLPDENLQARCKELTEEFGTCSLCYETDLRDKQNIMELCKWVNANHRLSVLINNAGVGGTSRFIDADPDLIDTIIQLNVKATSLITHQLLPNLISQPRSYVLNVSSIAAFSPIGYKTVYPASKAFIDHFTRGLSSELADTSVSVCLVSPGPMTTSVEKTERLKKQGLLGRLVTLTPEEVAHRSIRQLFKGDKAIVLGIFNRINLLLMRFMSRRYITWRVRQELDVVD